VGAVDAAASEVAQLSVEVDPRDCVVMRDRSADAPEQQASGGQPSPMLAGGLFVWPSMCLRSAKAKQPKSPCALSPTLRGMPRATSYEASSECWSATTADEPGGGMSTAAKADWETDHLAT